MTSSRLSQIDVFLVLNGQISIYKVTKHFVLESFAEKQKNDKISSLLTENQGLTPLEKCKFSTSQINVFCLLNGQISIYKVTKHFVLDDLAKKQKRTKFPNLTKNCGLTPFETCQIFDFLNNIFLVFNGYISIYKLTKHFVLDYFAEKQKGKKFKIFDQKTWTNPFRKMPIFKAMFFQSKMASFLSRRSQNTLFWTIELKNKLGQNFQFLTNNRGKMPIFDYLNRCLFQSKMACFLSRRSQNTFFSPISL